MSESCSSAAMVELCNFLHGTTTFRSLLMEKFKDKMMKYRNERLAIPFSNQFYRVHTFGKVSRQGGHQQDELKEPEDVAISYACHCVLISDVSNSRIQVFDLTTREFKTSIKRVTYHLQIEENYDGMNHDALILGNKDTIFKFDLEKLIQASMDQTNCDPIWSTFTRANPLGIAILRQERALQPNIIFMVLCLEEGNYLTLFNSETGKILKEKCITDMVHKPCGVAFTDENDLIVTETSYGRDKIVILSRCGSIEEWKVKTVIGKSGDQDGEFKCPVSVVYDRASRNIIVSDMFRIQVFTKDGVFVKSFNDDLKNMESELCLPTGMCLNELTGELFVCEHGNNAVHIFV